jgi:HD-GYP domain-containing protein (c-di-GMP phosphodiesterase class II)
VLARRLGLAPGVQLGLEQVYERWDGLGPGRIGGPELERSARVSHLVDVVEIAHRTGGLAVAVEVAAQRAGRHFDPEIAAVFVGGAGEILGGLEDIDMLDAALAAEPPPQPRCPRAELPELARAIADFADLKSPWTVGHSPAVAELAARAAPGPEEAEDLRLAGLLHDLGRLAVPNGIWDKAGGLGSAQWERVRLHPYYTERILTRTRVFAGVAGVAGAHHERLDGLGYHRGLGGDALTEPMRVLAVADAYVAMTSDRPHRPGRSAAAASREIRRGVAAGRWCERAAGAVLEAAGHGRGRAPAPPGGLSEREIGVLRLLARGLTNKQIAAELIVSPRTVQHHVAHIYDKIDRRTRAGAAMFAMEHRLV